jgi:hypothetical protein
VCVLDAERNSYLSELSVQRLMAPQNLAVKDDFPDLQTGPGFGTQINQSQRAAVGTVISIDGFSPGAHVLLRNFPKHSLAIAAFNNSSEREEEFSDLIRDVIDDALLRKAGIAKRKQSIELPEQVGIPTGLVSDAIASRYSTPGGLVVPDGDVEGFNFELAGFGLSAKPRPDGWFQLRYRLLGMIPLSLSFIENVAIRPVKRTSNGQRLLLYASGTSIGLLGSAITPLAVTDDAKRYLGRYQIGNPDALIKQVKVSDVELVLEDDQLILRAEIDAFINLDLAFPIAIHSNNRWAFAGYGPGLGELIEPSGGRQLLIAGYRLERE